MSGWRLLAGLIAGIASSAAVGCLGRIDTPEEDSARGEAAQRAAARGGDGRAGASGAAAVMGRGGAARGDEPGPAQRASDAGASSAARDAGASAEPEPEPEPERQYCDAFAVVFNQSCGNGSCHTNRGATIGDFAVGPEEAARYVGRSSVRNAECGLVIDPVEPQESLILTKVNGEYPADKPCGGPMPVGSFAITDEQIDCLSDWVEQFRR